MHWRKSFRGPLLLGVAALVGFVVTASAAASRLTDWPGYLLNAGHSSASAAAVITPSNAGTLRAAWSFTAAGPTMTGQPSRGFFSSPTVADGRVFIGANTGVFYALDESTGAILWQRFLGFQPTLTCPGRGLVSTAAVVTDPSTAQDTVYVGGSDGYLYALNATDGTVLWRSVVWQLPSTSVNDYYNWSSPVVNNGEVYLGVASNCDRPFVPAGVQAFNATTGNLDATWQSVPGNSGGGVWTSPAISSNGDVFVTTASGPLPPAPQGESYSIVHLAGSTLNQVDAWTVPASARVGDSDFASSPTLFSADLGGGTQTPMVAACNKNGILYGWQQSDLAAGPVWQYKVGQGSGQGVKSCLAAPIWDGAHLFVAGNPTHIQGISFAGSLQELDPVSGHAQWQIGLGGTILGTPSMDSAGLIAATTYATPIGTAQGTYLVDSTSGTILSFVKSKSFAFSQPVFAGPYLLVATGSGVLTAYTPATAGDTSPPTVPSGLQAVRSTDGTQAALTWVPSTDDVGVASYQIYRNSGLIATVAATSTAYTDPTAQAETAYTYRVQAVDTSGNQSPLSPPITSPPPTGLPVFADGFESGNFVKWTTNYGSIVVQSQYVDTGSFAALASSTGAAKAFAYTLLPNDYAQLYAKVRFDVISQPANNVDLIHFTTDQTAPLATLYLSPTGLLRLANNTLGTSTSSGVTPSKGAWHTLELELDVDGASSQTAVWLDGSSLTKLTTIGNYGFAPIGDFEIGDGHLSRTFQVAFDNVAVNTSYIP
jgi:outer membrane protein assembly factor BamB